MCRKLFNLIRQISSWFSLKISIDEIQVSRSDDDKVTIKKSGENGRLKGRFNGARVISTRFISACFHHQNRSISSLEISKRFVEVKIDRGRIRVSFYRFKIFAIKKNASTVETATRSIKKPVTTPCAKSKASLIKPGLRSSENVSGNA